MTPAAAPVVCIACSIFKREIQHLLQERAWDVPCRFLGSMLHLEPPRLEAGLEVALDHAQVEGARVVLAYGDCCPRMEELGGAEGVVRTQGLNCCELLLGRDAYRALRKEGAFFLLPEWTVNWKLIFKQSLGLEGINARTFMQEMHTRLVYLDTGLVPIPQAELDEITEFAGLPVAILPTSLEHLLASLKAAAAKVTPHG